jgi:hypothetical protein
MERRRALVVAGTLAVTLATAGTAMAVNLGLLGADSDSVGDLTVTDLQPAAVSEDPGPPTTRVIIQDIPVPGGSGTSSSGSTPGTVKPTTSFDDSSDDFDDDHDADEHDADEHEDEHEQEHEDDD